jgi:hypothetical protein
MKKTLKLIFVPLFLIILALSFNSCDDAGIVTPIASSSGKYSRTYGGSSSDVMTSMVSTSDGGYILAGYTVSFGAGDNDIYVIKLTAGGDVSWSKTYGSTGNDVCNSVKQTTDGGYILAGQTNSFGADSYDVFLIKTDGGGSVTWSDIYKVTGDQLGYSVVQDGDGYVVAGHTNENNAASNEDVFIMRTSADGTLLWKQLYGGQLNDYAYKMIKTSDGGFLIAGATYNFSAAMGDIYLVKAKSDGSLDWSRTYGADGYEQANDILETGGHDFMVAGYTKSYGLTSGDMILFKTDHNGNVYVSEGWPGTIGDSTGLDEANSVTQATDGSFFITGYTTNGVMNKDIFFAHYFNNSVFDYTRSYGSSPASDIGSVILPKSDGYVIGGTSAANSGNNDLMLLGMKADSAGKYISCVNSNVFNPVGGSATGFDGIPASTQSYNPPAEQTISVTLTVNSAGTTTSTQCSAQ